VNYWDKAARGFDSLYARENRLKFVLNRMVRRGLFQRVDLTCDVIRNLGSSTVLDVGCGSGRNIPAFLKAGASHVTGIDSSTEMLRLAVGLLQRTDSSSKTDLIPADFLQTTIPPTDIVVALGVFDYLHDDALPFLQKMGKCARSVAVFSAPSRSLVRMPLRAMRYRHKGISVHFYGHNELRALCERAGFPRFSVDRISSSGYFVTCWRNSVARKSPEKCSA
jgi:SAM-dependent methyltransferase